MRLGDSVISILTRAKLFPQERFDLEDFNLALSALRTDSHFYTKEFISNLAYILKGFTISQAYIGQLTANVDLTDATLINGNNTGDFSWWAAPTSPAPLVLPTGVGGLQNGRNYVELEIYAQDGTPLQRAFWDPSANSGAGVEFTQQVNTVTELFIKAHVNQTGFTGGNPNFIPLSIIDLDGSSNIQGIRDRRNRLFRLAANNDIHASFAWSSRQEPNTTLTFSVPSGIPFQNGETVTFDSGATATVVVGGTNNITVFDFSNESYTPGDNVVGFLSGGAAPLQSYYEAFSGADKDIHNYRDMFAALMTEIRNVKGTTFWYQIGNVASLTTLLNYINSILVPISSGARFSWSGTALTITDNVTSGQTTGDVIGGIRIPGYGGNLYLTRQDGTGGTAPLAIPDHFVLYVDLPTAGTSRTYLQSGNGPTNYQVASLGTFLPTDSTFIIAYREGNTLVLPSGGDLDPGEDIGIGGEVPKELLAYIGSPSATSTSPQYTYTPSADLSNQFSTNDSLTQSTSINAANINDIAAAILHPYEEKLTVVSGAPANSNEVTGPISSLSTLTLPLDSRNGSVQKQYKVGEGALLIFLNGQHLQLTDDYSEIGSPATLSSTFQINQALVVGDVLDIVLLIPQFIGSSGTNQPFFANYIIGQNGTEIPTGALYNTGTDRLQPWRNGLSMSKTTSIGPAINRYQESNNNALSVTQASNPSEVFVMVNHETPNPNVVLITGITGTVVTVPTYVIGNFALRVFRNGVLLTTNGAAPTSLSYTESSTTTVTLAQAAVFTDVFKIYRSGNPPTWRKSLTGVTGTTITIPGGVTFTPGSPKLLVFKNGLLMNDSLVIGPTSQQYQQSGNNAITIVVAAITSDLFEWIYV